MKVTSTEFQQNVGRGVQRVNLRQDQVTTFMQGPRQMPHEVASYCRHPATRYAMSDI